MELLLGVIWFVAFLISLSTHEYAHALAGYLQGDDTAERAGRLTLNPLAHADRVGTFMLPIAAILTGLPIIGWAKPVPYNQYNLRDQKWGPVIVGLSGPAANVSLIVIGLVMLRLVFAFTGLGMENLLVIFLVNLVSVNVFLGLFNLIPIPPLDGFRLAAVFLDNPQHRGLLRSLEMKGPMYLLIFLLVDSFSLHLLGRVFGSVTAFVFAAAGLA